MIMTEESAKVLQKLMALCSRGEKCESEAYDYMLRKGATEDEAALAVEYLVENKYVDNKRYARFFVADKLRFNKWGKTKIVTQLKIKKISSEDIEDALQESYSESDEKDLISEELAKKLRVLTKYPKPKIWEKLMRFAISRGYQYNNVKPLIDNLLGNLENDI